MYYNALLTYYLRYYLKVQHMYYLEVQHTVCTTWKYDICTPKVLLRETITITSKIMTSPAMKHIKVLCYLLRGAKKNMQNNSSGSTT